MFRLVMIVKLLFVALFPFGPAFAQDASGEAKRESGESSRLRLPRL